MTSTDNRKEFIAGKTYGIIRFLGYYSNNRAHINIAAPYNYASADELREASHFLAQLAETLKPAAPQPEPSPDSEPADGMEWLHYLVKNFGGYSVTVIRRSKPDEIERLTGWHPGKNALTLDDMRKAVALAAAPLLVPLKDYAGQTIRHTAHHKAVVANGECDGFVTKEKISTNPAINRVAEAVAMSIDDWYFKNTEAERAKLQQANAKRKNNLRAFIISTVQEVFNIPVAIPKPQPYTVAPSDVEKHITIRDNWKPGDIMRGTVRGITEFFVFHSINPNAYDMVFGKPGGIYPPEACYRVPDDELELMRNAFNQPVVPPYWKGVPVPEWLADRLYNASTTAAEPRRDVNGNEIPWPKDADYFMGFDPENPDIPTD